MRSIQKIKDWIKKPQFEMVHILDTDDSDDQCWWALRFKGNRYFNRTDLSMVVYKSRNATILDFSSDYITVLIEQIKEVLPFPEERYDPDNYDFIWVPINDIEHRNALANSASHIKIDLNLRKK